MKKKLLSTAIAAGLGLGMMSSAQAVYVNPEGTGQVLLFPYYTVEGGYNTNIHVVNTADVAKVVKVRFLESKNSQEVLDFNLYLSAQDEWTGAVVQTDDGAQLVTNDNSCTSPGNAAIKAGVDFRNTQYANMGDSDDSFERTREGYVEIIGMSDIVGNTRLETAVTHTSNGVPANCAYVTNNNTATLTSDMTAASGGLYGYGTLVNVGNGTAATYDATALAAFNPNVGYSAPGSTSPSLSDANSAATIFTDGQATDYTTGSGEDAVSAAIMASNVMNDYVVDPSINAGTDWVVTFPTKRFYVNGAGAPTNPFTTAWNSDTSTACESIGMTYYDREEQTTTSTLDFSPQPVQQGASLCYEANVISFNGTDVLAAENSAYNLNLDAGFEEGWANLDLVAGVPGHTVLAVNDATGLPEALRGLPAIGFSDIQFVNGDVGGLLTNYAGITKHKTSLQVDPTQVQLTGQ